MTRAQGLPDLQASPLARNPHIDHDKTNDEACSQAILSAISCVVSTAILFQAIVLRFYCDAARWTQLKPIHLGRQVKKLLSVAKLRCMRK